MSVHLKGTAGKSCSTQATPQFGYNTASLVSIYTAGCGAT